MSPQQLFTSHLFLERYWRGPERMVALEGLWKASQNCRHPESFRSYAFAYMRGAVLEWRRRQTMTPRRHHERGKRTIASGLMLQHYSESPNPEELLLEKERIVALRQRVAMTFGNEGNMLRASLLEEEHQAAAARRGLSKSWGSRINAKAERRLVRSMREFAP